jgi:hypothetical protein
MIELVAASQGQALSLFEARVIDTAIGCGMAACALVVERALYWTLRRWLRAAPEA